MLHIHVLLIPPLGTSYVPQPGKGQHESRVPSWKALTTWGAAADFPGRPINHIGGSDASAVLAGKITVGQRLTKSKLFLCDTNQTRF